jgi:hypothetical protein
MDCAAIPKALQVFMFKFAGQGFLFAAMSAWSMPAFAQAVENAAVAPLSDPVAMSSDACLSPAADCIALAPEGWDLKQSEGLRHLGSLAAPTLFSDTGSLTDFEGAEPAQGATDPSAPLPSAPVLEMRRWTDHASEESSTHRGIFKQLGTIKTETFLLAGYFVAQSGKKFFRETTSFHFKNEGFFGKDTLNLGVDKVTHAFDTYLLADIIHMRLHKKTNASHGDALTASLLASALMAFNELSDGIEPDSGYSMHDIAMNVVGAGFSYLRNTVPGMKEKVSFKIEIVPNDQIYSYRGAKHYEQQRFMLSFKGAGFERLKETPLRFVDLQVGYYASNLWNRRRAEGKEPKRHVFVGLGLNVGELLFANSRTWGGKAAYTVLDYFQPPYTSIR